MKMPLSFIYEERVDIKKGKIGLTITHNQKSPSTHVFLKFKTSENCLLDTLLREFVVEKFRAIGANPNNRADYMISNNNCIYLILPESNVLSSTLLIYKYLLTTKVPASVKKVFDRDQSYTKLHRDIEKGFEMIVTGKCKNLANKFSVHHNTIDNFIKKLNLVESKDFPDAKVTTAPYNGTFPIAGSDLAKLYMTILLSDMDFVFKGNSVVTCEDVYQEMKNKIREHQTSIKSIIKNFLDQMGKKKVTPAANDPDKSKMKVDNDCMLHNLNVMVRIVSELHNLPFKPLTMTTWTLNVDAIKEVKRMLK